MKLTLILLSCLWSYATLAAIVPPPPNYTIDATGNIVNAAGEIDDDPEQVVPLTPAEIPAVATSLTTTEDNIKLKWQKRQAGAKARAALNPALVK